MRSRTGRGRPAGAARPRDDAAPPPPPPRPPGEQAAAPAADLGLNGRLTRILSNLPDVPAGSVRATERNGVVTLNGTVPSVYEAMLAYRAAQQTPGVRSIVDRLAFDVPDGQRRNPLLQKGRPEDIEPYLEAQIRRQVDDQAHIDRVRVVGDRLEVTGSVAKAEDKPRIEAILRSMPLLRGFTLDATFVAE